VHDYNGMHGAWQEGVGLVTGSRLSATWQGGRLPAGDQVFDPVQCLIRGRTSPGKVGCMSRVLLALALSLALGSPVVQWAAGWAAVGGGWDPNGQTDVGGHWDPDGSPQTDVGNHWDPNGSPQTDVGNGWDPDG
jgi:hypothetical protein